MSLILLIPFHGHVDLNCVLSLDGVCVFCFARCLSSLLSLVSSVRVGFPNVGVAQYDID